MNWHNILRNLEQQKDATLQLAQTIDYHIGILSQEKDPPDMQGLHEAQALIKNASKLLFHAQRELEQHEVVKAELDGT